VASDLYDVAGFRAGRDALRPFEPELLGDVAGLRLVHLQCHFGLDSMSWARRGASVVGLDFSQPAVDAANDLATDLALDAAFVCADVYDAGEALGGERFDVVYTGFGALNWLPDLPRWASVVASLLRPGGRLLLAEFHPFSWVFADEDRSLGYDYFASEALEWEVDGGSYADAGAATANNRTIEHQHTLADVFGAVLGAGLRVDAFQEHGYTLFPRWPDLVRHDDGTFHLPEGATNLPLMYALVASAPA
jgi:SAM-dependent methyltransferase